MEVVEFWNWDYHQQMAALKSECRGMLSWKG